MISIVFFKFHERQGHVSLLCEEDCTRLVSSCVEWARAPPELTAAALCARLAPPHKSAPCVPLTDYMGPSKLAQFTYKPVAKK